MKRKIDKEIKEYLDYCPTSGVFVWRRKPGYTTNVGSIAGNIVYSESGESLSTRIRFRGDAYLAQNLAWFYVNGDIGSGFIVDHKDGDRQNNAIANLKLISSNEYLSQGRPVNRVEKTGLTDEELKKEIQKLKGITNCGNVTRLLSRLPRDEKLKIEIDFVGD